MPPSDEGFLATVLDHIVELAQSRCSITEAQVEAQADETLRAILAAMLMLHEELVYRDEQRLEAQRRNLELSTPILEVGPKVLLIPLIGAVDSPSSQDLVERALGAVAGQGAKVLVIDITGVAEVGAGVAGQLIHTIKGVKLLGARTILTGVSPANAQTLVDLDIDLSAVLIERTLGAGLRSALQLSS